MRVTPEGVRVRRSQQQMQLLVVVIVATMLSGAARADRVDDLARALTTDSSWRVRLQAAVVLGRLHDPRGAPALMRALSDPLETVRGMAAQVLGDLGDQEAVAALERLKRDPSPFVRGQATVALGKLTGAPPPELLKPSAHALHVEVGGIGSKTALATPELTRRLREFIVRELMQTPGLTMEGAPRNGYLIDSAITSLSHRTIGSTIEITCEVSLIVGRLPSKAMVMMTSGGATVQTSKANLRPDKEQALEVDALEGAVHGAHENLLAFLKSQR